jgi:hypothetical protein
VVVAVIVAVAVRVAVAGAVAGAVVAAVAVAVGGGGSAQEARWPRCISLQRSPLGTRPRVNEGGGRRGGQKTGLWLMRGVGEKGGNKKDASI